MINKKSWLKVLILVFIFGILSAGIIHAQVDTRLNGTWVNLKGFAYSFNNGDFSVTGLVAGIRMNFDNGTYTISGNTVTVTTRLFGTYRANFSINGNVLTWTQEGWGPDTFRKVD